MNERSDRHLPSLRPQQFIPVGRFQFGAILMPNIQDDFKAHLMETNEEFRRLAEEHRGYGQKLEALNSRNYLTPEEQVEEIRLKKIKLRLKDQMEGMLSRLRTQQVA
jgi:uncharacterized protein YdcH (DUF465 family)